MPIRPLTRDQIWLMPPSLDELIPAEHGVRFVATFVDSLDLPALALQQPSAGRGGLEYDLRLLLSAWLYGFMIGVRSTRRLEQLAHENLPMIWLLGGQRPDHSTLARFLQRNRAAMKGLFRQTVQIAVQVGLVDFAFQAIDGTRVANVSFDKAQRRQALEELEAQLERVLQEMEQGAVRECALAGEADARLMPAALADPVRRRAQVQEALAALARHEAARRTTKKGAVDARTGERKGPKVSLADPEAVMMKGRHGYVMGYNAQAAVDGKAQVIVAAEVVAAATDNAQQGPMLQATQENTGRLAEVTALDGGYYAAQNLEAAEGLRTALYVTDPALQRAQAQPERERFHKDAFVYQMESDTFLCPAGQLLQFDHEVRERQQADRAIRVYRCRVCQHCAHYGVCTNDRRGRRVRIRPQEGLIRRHREKMRGEQAKAFMKRRSAVVEPVFAIMRERMGLGRFLRRGWAAVRAEWDLLCGAYNLRKLFKHRNEALPVLLG